VGVLVPNAWDYDEFRAVRGDLFRSSAYARGHELFSTSAEQVTGSSFSIHYE
jgi:hypothetical protein